MKKAKILLTAVGILSVVGGVFAFKASNEHTFYKTTVENGPCNVTTTLRSSTVPNPQGVPTQLSIAPTTSTSCGTIRLTLDA